MPRRRLDRWPSATLLTPRGGPLGCAVADRPWRRLAGLALLPAEPVGALLLPGCSSVHTAGMRFWIDIAFLSIEPDGAGCVRAVRAALGPGRLAGAGRRAGQTTARTWALELPAGSAERLGLRPGAPVRLLGPAAATR